MHVLDTLFAYIIIAKKQYENIEFQGEFNIGPNYEEQINNEKLINMLDTLNVEKFGFRSKLVIENDNKVIHETNTLKLDSSKFRAIYNWTPQISINKAIRLSFDLYYTLYNEPKNVKKEMQQQIINFIEGGFFR
jgi:CDP-glucose 4,6-dehydratase